MTSSKFPPKKFVQVANCFSYLMLSNVLGHFMNLRLQDKTSPLISVSIAASVNNAKSHLKVA